MSNIETMTGDEIDSLLNPASPSQVTPEAQLDAKRINDEKAQAGRKSAEEKRWAQIAETAAKAAAEASRQELASLMARMQPQAPAQVAQAPAPSFSTAQDDPFFDSFDSATKAALMQREQRAQQMLEQRLAAQRADLEAQFGDVLKQHTGQVENHMTGMRGMVFETSLQSHAPKYAALQADSDFSDWNTSPNPLYGGSTPEQMMLAARKANNPQSVVQLANAQAALYESAFGGSPFQASPSALGVATDIAAPRNTQKLVKRADLEAKIRDAMDAGKPAEQIRITAIMKQLEREGRLA